MSGRSVVDVWYHGCRYEVLRGQAPGWGLRIFFNVEDDEDLWVLDSSSSVKTKIDPMGTYYVSHYERFYSISKKVIGFQKEEISRLENRILTLEARVHISNLRNEIDDI